MPCCSPPRWWHSWCCSRARAAKEPCCRAAIRPLPTATGRGAPPKPQKTHGFPASNGLGKIAPYIDDMSSNRHYAAPHQAGRGAPKMAIGEFGGAPVAGGPVLSNGLYWLYEMSQAALNPSRALADVTRLYFKNPLNPLAHTTFGKTVAATAELFERSTRRYAK